MNTIKTGKVLALVVALAMVLSVMPGFAMVAGAATYAENADSFVITFKLPDSLTGYADIQITDKDGDVITGFCLSNDGFHPFHREQVKDKATSVADYDGTAPAAFSDTPDETSVKPLPAGQEVKITYTKTEEGYSICYELADHKFTRTYTTDVEINGVVSANSWAIAPHDGCDITDSNIMDKYILESKVNDTPMEKTPAASITIKKINEAGESIVDDTTVEGYLVGQSYTTSVGYPEYVEKDGKYYLPAKDQAKTVTIDKLEAENTIEFKYTEADFKAVDVPTDPVRIGYVEYTPKGKNLIANPSFETTDGRFNILGWKSQKTKDTFGFGGDGTPYGHGYIVKNGSYSLLDGDGTATTDENYTVKDGDFAFGSRWNDGFGDSGLCSLYTNVEVGHNKTIYFSYWTKAYTTNEAFAGVHAVAGGADAAPAALETHDVIRSDVQGDWTLMKNAVTTDETTDTVQFLAYWLGDAGAGAHPYFLFDNFVVAEADVTGEAKDTTVTYTIEGKPDYEKSFTEKAWPDEEVVFDAFEDFVGGVAYTADSVTLKGGESRKITLTADTNRIYPTLDLYINKSDIKGHDETKPKDMLVVAATGDTNKTTDADGNSTTTAPSGLGSSRIGVVRFDKPSVDEGQQVILNLTVGYMNKNIGGSNTKVYAFKYDGATDGETVDTSSDDIIKGLDAASLAWSDVAASRSSDVADGDYLPSGSKLAIDVTDIVAASEGETVTIGLGAAYAGLYIVDSETSNAEDSEFAGQAPYLAVVDGKTVSFTGVEAAKVTKNGSVVKTPVVAQEGDTIRAYDAEDGKLLVGGVVSAKVAADTAELKLSVPAVTAKLGYANGKLAIFFESEAEGAKAVITHSNDYTLKEGETFENEVTLPAAVIPNNANVVYEVKAVDANGEAFATASQALYPLVIADIEVNSAEYAAAEELSNVDQAVKALTEGGAVYNEVAVEGSEDGATELKFGDARDNIFDLSVSGEAEAATVTISVKPELAAKGFGFKAGVKAGKVDAVKAATGDGNGVFTTITITGDDVTLASPQEAVTLSLDSVEIEFVETEVAESEAADADASYDFTPEL